MARKDASLAPFRLTALGVAVMFGFGVRLSGVALSTTNLIGLIVTFLIAQLVAAGLCFLCLLKRAPAAAVYAPPADWMPARCALAPEPRRASDLAERLRAIDWFQFERLVGQIYRDRGFIVTECGGARADGGIDLIVEKNGRRTAVQCKHWQNWKLGVAKVREFLGAMTAASLAQGHLVVLNGWTDDAATLAGEHQIKLIGESDLLRLLVKVEAAYNPDYAVLLDNTRKHCPKCGSELVRRTAEKGARAGNQFWGCETFPRCRFTLAA